MTTLDVISEAERIGRAAYAGVLDKAGKPYWDHCIRVADRARALGVSAPEAIAAALLHDAIEDDVIGWRDILHLPTRTKDLIGALTRRHDGRTYGEYIRAIADSGDSELIRIKLADNLDNTSIDRGPLDREPGLALRYARARKTLEASLKETER